MLAQVGNVETSGLVLSPSWSTRDVPARQEDQDTAVYNERLSDFIAALDENISSKRLARGRLAWIRMYIEVAAQALTTEECDPGDVYNICTGEGYPIERVLDMLLRLSERKDIRIETDPQRLRPSDVLVLIGDCTKFRAATGWKPTIPFEKTVEDSLNYWRSSV